MKSIKNNNNNNNNTTATATVTVNLPREGFEFRALLGRPAASPSRSFGCVDREDAAAAREERTEDRHARAHLHTGECGFDATFAAELNQPFPGEWPRRPDYTNSACRLSDSEALSALRRVLRRGKAAPTHMWEATPARMRSALLAAARHDLARAKLPRKFMEGLEDTARYIAIHFILPSGSEWWAAVAEVTVGEEEAGTCWLFRTVRPHGLDLILDHVEEDMRPYLTDVYRIVPA